MTQERDPEGGLSLGDYARYAGLFVFGSLVILIGLGDTDHAYLILFAVWLCVAVAGGLFYLARRSRS